MSTVREVSAQRGSAQRRWEVLIDSKQLCSPPTGSGMTEGDIVEAVLSRLGPVLDNPKYVPDRARRR